MGIPVLVASNVGTQVFSTSMTITVDNSTAGANRLIVATYADDRLAVDLNCTAIDWNVASQNLSLTKRVTREVVVGLQWWDAVAPAVVSSSAVYTLAGNDKGAGVVACYDTVDQATPVSDLGTAEQGGMVTSSTGDVANVTTNDLTQDWIGIFGGNPVSALSCGGSQTQVQQTLFQSGGFAASNQAGSGTLTDTWSWTGTSSYSWLGYRIHGAAAAGVFPKILRQSGAGLLINPDYF